MKILLTINGHEHTLEQTEGKPLSCRFDGAPFEAEAVEIAPGVYSILLDGKSFAAHVGPDPEPAEGAAGESKHYGVQVDGASYAIAINDPRRWTRVRGAMAREGRQQITAPMPGKIVRILVHEGQRVVSGEGLVVVEAMKMQNEIKCHAAGTVEKVLIREGQPVTAGESLLIIE
ncbi:MAG: biotin/lipoyl-binding protein [Acidobacteria bacterium]|nr:biotin/lipoyl-binding protein [Acidobacteriota bacterium]